MGRKRKANAVRHPSGQIKYEAPRPHRQRLNDLARLLRDPMLGSHIGHMRHAGDITEAQYEAGRAYAEAMADWVACMGLPSRAARAQDMSRVNGLSLVDDPEQEGRNRVKAQKRLEGYDIAIGLHSLELSCVQATCVDELAPVGAEHREALIRGLTRLAAWRKGGRT